MEALENINKGCNKGAWYCKKYICEKGTLWMNQDFDARGMSWDWLQWRHFVYRGDINEDGVT